MKLRHQVYEGLPDQLCIRQAIAALQISKRLNIKDSDSLKYKLDHLSKNNFNDGHDYSSLLSNVVSKDDEASIDLIIEYMDYEYAYNYIISDRYNSNGARQKLVNPSTIEAVSSSKLRREQFNYYLAILMLNATRDHLGQLRIVPGSPNTIDITNGKDFKGKTKEFPTLTTEAEKIFQKVVVSINNVLASDPSIVTSITLEGVLRLSNSTWKTLTNGWSKFTGMRDSQVAQILQEFGVTEDMILN